MNKEKDLLFEVDGFKVYSNSVYFVKDKIDYDAPSGFEKEGVSKLPHDGVTHTFTAKFAATDSQGKEGTWDTGFFSGSNCFRNLSRSQAEIEAKSNWERVAKPYLVYNSMEESVLSPSATNEWWDKKLMEIHSGKTFNTSKPNEVFELYFALLNGVLTPEGQEGNAKYRFPKSSYVIIDIESKRKRKDEINDFMFEAVGTFTGLLKTDRTGLNKLLDYVGLTVSETVSESALKTMFRDFIESSESKMKLFLKVAEEFQSDAGREKIELYKILKSRYPAKGVTKSNSGEFLFEGLEIGGDLKTAAQNIATRTEFSDLKKTLILGE